MESFKNWMTEAANIMFDDSKNDLRSLPKSVRLQILIVLSFVWSTVFSLYVFSVTSFIFGSLYYFTYLTKPDTHFMKKYLFGVLMFYIFANLIVLITCAPQVQSFLINGGVDPNSIISIFPIVCGDTIDIILSSFGAFLFTGYLYYSFGKLMRGDYGSPALLAWDIYWSVLLLFSRILKLNKILAGR